MDLFLVSLLPGQQLTEAGMWCGVPCSSGGRAEGRARDGGGGGLRTKRMIRGGW